MRAARALRDRVDHDPGLIKDPEVLAQLRRNSDDPETARDALAAMANVPGPISADLIYEVWTATAQRTTATDLARSLIYSKEVRAKASKALAVALDLRDADSCEKKSRSVAPSDQRRRSPRLPLAQQADPQVRLRPQQAAGLLRLPARRQSARRRHQSREIAARTASVRRLSGHAPSAALLAELGRGLSCVAG